MRISDSISIESGDIFRYVKASIKRAAIKYTKTEVQSYSIARIPL